jgi:thioredoxin 2
MGMTADERGLRVACPGCGQANRLRFETLDRDARCGRCGAALARPGEPVDVPSEGTFDALVSRSPLPVVVDWWAPWCGPCRRVAPELEKVASAARGRLVVAKVNTDAVPQLGARHGIRSIPTMAVFAGGREVSRSVGALPAAGIEQLVRAALADAGRGA